MKSKNIFKFLVIIGFSLLASIEAQALDQRSQAKLALGHQLLLLNRLPLLWQVHFLKLDKDSAEFSYLGGNGSVKISTAGIGKISSWNIENTNSWITITSGKNGIGSGILKFSVEPLNLVFPAVVGRIVPGPIARKGILKIAGQAFTVSQRTAYIIPSGSVTSFEPMPNPSPTSGATISGSGSIINFGSGTLTLGAANSYSGATAMSGGTLVLGAANTYTGATLTLSEAPTGTLTLSEETIGRLILREGTKVIFSGGTETPSETITSRRTFAVP